MRLLRGRIRPTQQPLRGRLVHAMSGSFLRDGVRDVRFSSNSGVSAISLAMSGSNDDGARLFGDGVINNGS
ncbi:hypothetical protein RJT34_25550 [Clitoria ternatea]|uniref:Uncharacterized protein n=1 Tax=Clitoria ternatea TaxID=43366 RepID=A0AAN9FSP4_CLITE